MRRRDALVIGGVMAAAIAIPPVLRRLPSDFEFEPIPGFDGFRKLSMGPVSGGVNPFFGLDERLPDQAPLYDGPVKNPCLALFGDESWQGDTVPVAIFSDFNCPYCKVLEGRLIAMRDAGAPIQLMWHEMPLLGPGSYRSAKAVLAARFLGQEDAARDYLKARSLRPGRMALSEMAEALGLLPDMLIREFQSRRVANALGESLNLGTRLGIPGTPGTVFGRTLVIGAISDADIRALIKLERATPQTVCS